MRTQTQVTLDRAQREAIRSEMELRACGWGDLQWGVTQGDRRFAYKEYRRVGRMMAVMDAIGWSEQPDTPDKLPIARSGSLAAWARREAQEIFSSFSEIDAPDDQHLDAYEAFCTLGTSEAV
jgi:hypothetical protein